MDANTQTAEGRVILDSVLTCPCGGCSKEESMPTDACIYFYESECCKIVLKPKPGDCCVFCSCGSKVPSWAAPGLFGACAVCCAIPFLRFLP